MGPALDPGQTRRLICATPAKEAGAAPRPNSRDMPPIRYTGHAGWPLTAFTPEDAPPAAPVLVLLPGGGPAHRSLVPLALRTAGSRHVNLPDLSGCGRAVRAVWMTAVWGNRVA